MNEDMLFNAAMKLTPPQRGEFLAAACSGNSQLRGEVEALLCEHDAAGSFLGRPPVFVSQTELHCPPTEKPGSLIGPYKLLEQIGEGGMGLVFMAEQQQPVRRLVALKLVKPGMDSKQVIARFEAERQALAMMDHPNIAKVHDAGTTEVGRPYFVMELVRGIPLNEFCDQKQLSVSERLELFIDVCQAVQHAHQKGIIHRDLKPTNVLVTMADAVPFPKVIDFGVAKALGQSLTDHALHTGYSQLVGTPLYMSPEQAEMNLFGVDTRSDVYSLGVMLYELLTGTTPFDKERMKIAGFDEMRRMIREDEPPRPSNRLSTIGAEALSTISQRRSTDPRRISAALRGEIDWIVMKALEKDRSRRYESASALAADIQRYLSDEPVFACPPTTMYRFQKLARKHKAALATTAAIAACLILGTTVSAWQAVRATTAEAQANANAAQAQEKTKEATDQRDEAKRQRDEVKALNEKLAAKEQQLQRSLYASNMNLARHAWEEDRIERVAELLAQHAPKPGDTDMRGFEWHYLNRLCHSELLTLKGHTNEVFCAVYSPDGKHLASSSKDKTVKVWNAETAEELLTLKGNTDWVFSVTYSPDGMRLASVSRNWNPGPEGTVKVWDARTGEELLTFQWPGRVGRMTFRPDGKRLAGANGEEVKVWDVLTGQELHSWKWPATNAFPAVAYSQDGKRLAGAGGRREVKMWDAQTGQELLSFNGGGNDVAFSPDGKRLASVGEGEVKVWDAQTGKEIHTLEHSGAECVAFSPDGERLVADSGDGILRIWDLNTGKELRTIKSGGGYHWQVAFSPDGRCVATASTGNTGKVWDVEKDQENFALHGAGGKNFTYQGAGGTSVTFSPDFKRLASAARDNTVNVWDAQSGQQTLTLKGHTVSVLSVAFSPDGKRLASGGCGRTLPKGSNRVGPEDRGEVKIWDAQTGQELFSLSPPENSQVVWVAFSPDGKRLAYHDEWTVRIFDAQTGLELRTLKLNRQCTNVAFSPDGKRLVTAYVNESAKVWDAQTGQELLSFEDVGHFVAFSPDGKRLAGVAWDETRIWDAQTGKELLILQGSGGSNYVSKLVFSPDGKRLVGASKVWDAETGQELLSLKGAGHGVAFSPDGHRLATNAPGGIVRIYDATPLKEVP